ncbi:MAG: hypothetical protein K2X39_08710 [Silvanigrellaceae bacterium]|nr:hypothetical protein [Silvanigrellaceae bacterium]
MRKLNRLMIGFGFAWITFWSVFGTLLGAQKHARFQIGDSQWIDSWQNQLLRSAHAHMNSMGMTIILMGLSLSYLISKVPNRVILICGLGNIISVVLFGVSIVIESYFTPSVGLIHWSRLFVALSAFGYILTIGSWSCFFLAKILK